MLVRMKELVGRIDGNHIHKLLTIHTILAKLYSHLESQNIEFLQFAFRWMNCLLMREMSLRNVIRMWDTYLASLLLILA